MYYKVIQDGVIVDAWDSPQFVKYKIRHNAFVSSTPEEADGVVLPSGSDIWILDTSKYQIEGKEVAKLVEIPEDEYNTLLEELEETGGGIKEPDPEPDPEPEPQPEPEPDPEPDPQPEPEAIMSRAEMVKAIRELQAENAEMKEQYAMLEGGLMEMSEMVYE